MQLTCPFCLNNKFSHPMKIKSKISNKECFYYKCKSCHSIIQYPLPDVNELINYYENYYKIKQILNPGYLEEKNRNNLFKERDLTLNEIGFDKRNFLDKVNVEIGVANGDFLRYMLENGAKKIIGIDISRTLLNNIKLNNIKLIHGDLSLLPEKSIDNLFLFNVLEHMTDINKTFTLLLSRIKDDSKIIIEIPLAGIISSFFNKKWRFLMPDEHLNIPSLKGFKILVKRYNFKIVGLTRFGSGFTTGMINFKIKKIFDFVAKKLKIGDRGTFLLIKSK